MIGGQRGEGAFHRPATRKGRKIHAPPRGDMKLRDQENIGEAGGFACAKARLSTFREQGFAGGEAALIMLARPIPLRRRAAQHGDAVERRGRQSG